MRWGKRHYHHESYLTRQHAKYKRRLKKQLIPGYGRHRKGSIKQWQNRVHERYYRQHTYPSYSERLRMWGEGYNPHPRRRTYTLSYRKTSRRRPSTSNESGTSRYAQISSDDDSDDGCLGCGCLSFILAVFFGISASSYSLFFFVFFLCLIIYAIFAHHSKMHSKTKPKSSPKSSVKSEASSSRSSQASASSSSASSNPLQAQSLVRSTADSLQNVMDSVVAKSNEGNGFDSYSVHHSIHRAESSMKSIYPSGDAHRSYTMSLLSGMYSDVTRAGKEFSPNASATVSIHFSVDGTDSSSSSNHSSSSTYTSDYRNNN